MIFVIKLPDPFFSSVNNQKEEFLRLDRRAFLLGGRSAKINQLKFPFRHLQRGKKLDYEPLSKEVKC